MANRRPIRAPRQGWRRGRRRPSRWIDCFSSVSTAGSLGTSSLALSASSPADVAASYRELLVGNSDTEWADANEVLVERIVGQISLSGADAIDNASAAVLYGNWEFLLPVVRLGLLVVEDMDQSANPLLVPSLLNADDLQDAEWMWLFQLGSPNETHIALDTVNEATVRTWTHDVQLDVRVKRKLGRRDRLLLVQDWSLRGAAYTGDHTVTLHPLLRGLVTTK